jgi:hypothetical protein
MLLTLQSRAILNNGVEVPRLGLGVYQTPSGETTFRLLIGINIVNNRYTANFTLHISRLSNRLMDIPEG